MQLNENVKELDDLDVQDFIKAVKNLGNMRAAEQLDGAHIWFGLDDSGELFTSKPNANQRFYAEKDYPYLATFNGLRTVHSALESKLQDLKSIMEPGDIIEATVIFGRQPNAVTYGLDGKNFIALDEPRGTMTELRFSQLQSTLQNQEVVAKAIIVDSSDGLTLERKAITETFRFISEQAIEAKSFEDGKIQQQLDELNDYLRAASGIDDLTNFELLTTSVGSIDKSERDEAKELKKTIENTILNKFKLPIKRSLLKLFSKHHKPKLGAADSSADEDVGIAGIVFTDPSTGQKVRLGDDHQFDTVNQFNFAVRNNISGTVKTTDETAPLEVRGGLVGQMRIRIAEFLGEPNLAITRLAKKFFEENAGATAQETIRNVAGKLRGAEDFNGTKNKIIAVITATLQELSKSLDDFKKYKDSTDDAYRLKLKNGKSIGLSQSVVNKTLLAFAEARRNLQEMLDNVKGSKTFDQLVASLYGKIAKAVAADESDEPVTESVKLTERKAFTDVSTLQELKSAEALIYSYIMTVLISTLIYKADDKRGLRFVMDKAHYKMTKLTDEMSQLNYWGFALWNSGSTKTSKILNPTVSKQAHKIAVKIPRLRITNLHQQYSYNHEYKINFEEHLGTLKLLLRYTGGNGYQRLEKIIEQTFKYDDLSFSKKLSLLQTLFLYCEQYIQTTPLMLRLKAIQNKLLLTGDGAADVVVSPNQSILGEDDAGAVTAGDVGGSTGGGMQASQAQQVDTKATSASSISSVETGIGRGYRIVKRKRNPKIKFYKFSKPKDKA